MKESLLLKLETLSERKTELEGMLSAPEIINDQKKFRELSREYAEVEPVSACYHRFNDNQEAIVSAKEMMKDSDPDMREMAVEEMKEAEANIETLEQELQILLLPKDPSDNSNIFLEVRAGTGGDEAALFVGDLLRMYTRYADSQKWKMEPISQNVSEAGGYKEVIVRIIGQGAYSRLKFESGVHRVQRVPETESQGRVHTSACTVAVLPEVDEVEEIDINPADLRVDTFRASGAGGQHVNKTDSAIRITHVPTGVVVECQEDRSQHKNKARAMTLLKSRLLSSEREKQESEQAENRRSLVGTGDRSERIRTYNFPQGRVTDHRINLTLYKLDTVMEGDVDQVIEPLIQEHQADLFASMGDS